MIDSPYQAEIDRNIRDRIARQEPLQPNVPPTPGFFKGSLSSPFRGVGAGGVEMGAFGSEIAGAFGQVLGSYPEMFGPTELTDAQRKQANEARDKLLTKGIDYSSTGGDELRAKAKDIMPDPNTTGAAGMVISGLTNFATKAVGYAAAGPAGPALLAGDVGMTEADKLKQQEVALGPRTASGLVAGAAAGVSVAVPMVGATALKTAGLVAAVGPGGYIAQTAAEKAILKGAGYGHLADQYDPLDPVALALATLIPAAFGAAAVRARAKPTGPIKTEAQAAQAVKLTPAEQAMSDTFERSAGNLRELQAAIQAEKRPEVKAQLQAEFAKQAGAAAELGAGAAARVSPELVDAVRVNQAAAAIDSTRLTNDADVPGFTAHTDAVEKAADQIGAGDRVNVTDVMADQALDPARIAAVRKGMDDMRAALEGERVEPVPARPVNELAASVDRMRATMDATGRRELDISARLQEAQGMLARGSGAEAIARAQAAGTELHPVTNNLLVGAGEVKMSALVDRYTQEAMTAKPGAQAHDLVATAVDAVRAGKPTEKVTPLAQAAHEAAAVNPDMLIPGEQPVRVADYLAGAAKEAAETEQDASLLRVAVSCFLRH